jgi:hypothetical protein
VASGHQKLALDNYWRPTKKQRVIKERHPNYRGPPYCIIWRLLTVVKPKGISLFPLNPINKAVGALAEQCVIRILKSLI